MQILKYKKDAKEEWTWQELQELGKKALGLVDEKDKLPNTPDV